MTHGDHAPDYTLVSARTRMVRACVICRKRSQARWVSANREKVRAQVRESMRRRRALDPSLDSRQRRDARIADPERYRRKRKMQMRRYRKKRALGAERGNG